MTIKTITEIKNKLLGGQKAFDCDYLTLDSEELVVIYTMQNDIVLENIPLKKGTRSLGYFWVDRNYNAYHWIDENLNTLALYFNVADRTSITEHTVEWRDLIVDVLLNPKGEVMVLDEDELPEDIDNELLVLIENTRDQLVGNKDHLLDYFATRSKQLMRNQLN